MKRVYAVMITLIAAILAGGLYLNKKIDDERGIVRDSSGYQYINTIKKLNDFYPLTVQEIKARSEYIETVIPKELALYLKQDPTAITKQEALYALDAFAMYYETIMAQFYLISMVHPDQNVATLARSEIEKLEKFSIDLFTMNRDLYMILKVYAEKGKDKDQLSAQERYYLEESIKSYERNGLNLPLATRFEIADIKKELAELEMQFNTNIAQDNAIIEVDEYELEGVSDDFIATLTKNDQGKYILKTDYPTHEIIMNHCKVANTRKEFYTAMTNKAYPINEPILKQIISKRHKLAQLLGFENFAEYDLSGQMAHDPKIVKELLSKLDPYMTAKAFDEMKTLTQELPEGVQLAQGKINPWDWSYIDTQYTKKHYNFDPLVMAQYFPLEETIEGLFKIYEQFFSITLNKIVPEKTWHEDVFVIQVSRDQQILGYICVDLHPRDNKYSHAAVFSAKNTHRLLNGKLYPGVCALVCNFTKPTDSKPSLLTFNEVTTFFHEFGHALHNILSDTHLLSQSGTNVKRDFVELPSQMLELWLQDPAILKSLSKHYQTGQSLPDTLIKTQLELLTLTNGFFELRQAVLAHVALELFEKPEHENMYDIYYRYTHSLLPFINQQERFYFLCKFGHLCGYGAKYYGYLWSRIFATDVFDQIKKEGLLNPEAGKKYLDTILSQGGSKDPNELLYDYLGRKPSQEAFLRRNKFKA